MTYQAMSYELREGVAWITINRPASLNAMDLPAMEEFLDIANRVSTERRVRAALITGAGDKAFCAGGDVAGFAAAGEEAPLLLQRMTAAYHMAISRLAWMRAPVIGAVGGVAAGAGLSLVAACDLVVASEKARFTSAYTGIGLSPDGSGTWFLSRIIGTRRATELFLTNRTLSAAEALDWGLVNQVVPPEALLEKAGALATGLAQGPTEAHGMVKKLLQMAPQDSLEGQMEREARGIAAMAMTADGKEGVRAFAAKRRPVFRGE